MKSPIITAKFKKTKTSFEVFSLRLTRCKPRGKPRRKPEAELKNKYKNYTFKKNTTKHKT
ncbi:hypothetical protein Hanom_Chr03g00193221 [Helianthus anomalus]